MGPAPGTHYKDVVTYQQAHKRVQVARGKASSHKCSECGKQAHQWSLQHDRVSVPYDDGKGHPYSLDVDDYEPMCTACHRTADMRRIRDAAL
jgi:hypothetical protein